MERIIRNYCHSICVVRLWGIKLDRSMIGWAESWGLYPSGGMGKSSLAAEVVWRLAPADQPPARFPDGIIFHSFYSQPQVDLALESLARAFGESPKPTPRDAARRALAGRHALILLDGTEDADDLPCLLSVVGSCGVLITSRHRKDATAIRYDLPALHQTEAVQLLQAWGDGFAANRQAAQKICQLLGGLPLAVRLVGRYLAETEESASEYLDWLTETPLSALDHGEHQLDSVSRLLERNFQQIGPIARQILALVGMVGITPLGRQVMATALDLSPTLLRRALGELVSYGLLNRISDTSSTSRYEVSHTLVHTYARRRLTLKDEVQQRLHHYYQQLLTQAMEAGPVGYHQLDRARPHILRILAECVTRQEWDTVQSLTQSLEIYLELQGHATDRLTVLEFGLTASRALGDQTAKVTLLGKLANTQRDMGQVEAALNYYQQALPLSRQIEHNQEEVALLGNLGLTYRMLGQAEQAITYQTQALALARQMRYQKEEAVWLGNLGMTYYVLGQIEEAIGHVEQALEITRLMGNRRNEEALLGNLGLLHQSRQEMEKAVACYKLSLVIAREIGHRRGEAAVLGNLGLAYQVLQKPTKALKYHQQALVIARETGHRRDEGGILNNIGSTYRDLNQPEQAIASHEQALKMARQIADRRGEGINLHNLGKLYRDAGHDDRARKYLSDALQIFEAIKSPYAAESREYLAELANSEQSF